MKPNANQIIISRKGFITGMNRCQHPIKSFFIHPPVIVIFFKIPEIGMTADARDIRIGFSRDQVADVLRKVQCPVASLSVGSMLG